MAGLVKMLHASCSWRPSWGGKPGSEGSSVMKMSSRAVSTTREALSSSRADVEEPQMEVSWHVRLCMPTCQQVWHEIIRHQASLFLRGDFVSWDRRPCGSASRGWCPVVLVLRFKAKRMVPRKFSRQSTHQSLSRMQLRHRTFKGYACLEYTWALAPPRKCTRLVPKYSFFLRWHTRVLWYSNKSWSQNIAWHHTLIAEKAGFSCIQRYWF